MSLKKRKDNPTIVITPKSLGDMGSIRVPNSLIYGNDMYQKDNYFNDLKKQADEIVSNVRHVSEVGHIRVEWDTLFICEHCGWVYDEETNEPDCCDESVSEWFIEDGE